MKLRYYLRGLGIGMLVAALVLILSGNTDGSMSDEAVKRRAAQLGMVEKNKSVLEDIRETDASADGTAGESLEPGEAEGMTASGDAGVTAEADPASEGGAEGADPASGEGVTSEDGAPGGSASSADDGSGSSPAVQEGAEEPVQDDEQQALAKEIEQKADEAAKRGEAAAESAAAVKTVTFVVQQGDTSVSVARRAQEMGLVSSAADFDVFLCQNGYDKRISIGSYEIPDGTGQKELADIITRSR